MKDMEYKLKELLEKEDRNSIIYALVQCKSKNENRFPRKPWLPIFVRGPVLLRGKGGSSCSNHLIAIFFTKP
jgi:hypothetical protein